MGSVSVSAARSVHGGNDVVECASALARAEGYHVIVWLKKGGDWKEDRFGCCLLEQEVRQYLSSPYSTGAEIVYDDGTAMSEHEAEARAMEMVRRMVPKRWWQFWKR